MNKTKQMKRTKKMKKILLWAMLMLTMVVFSACQKQQVAEVKPEVTPVQTAAEGKRTVYPLTITTYNFDKQPVQYTFDKAPERVVAMWQNNIETMLALGLADKIVAACGMDGEIRPDLKEEFSKIKYYESMPPKEDILAMNPDFITAWCSTFSDKNLGNVSFYHDRKTGTYMSLNSGCTGPADQFPRTVEAELEDILTLGKIMDVQEKAEALVAQVREECSKVEAFLKASGKKRVTVAVLEDEGGSYRTYGEDTLGGSVAKMGGAELVAGKKGNTANISAEDLVALNPEAIFMVWYNGYTVGDQDYAGEHVVKLITENPAFASLDAVKNNRVYAINLSGIYCSGLRTLDGILTFSKNLYPELYQ